MIDPNIQPHRGVPTWFRARCMEASRGGADSFRLVGRNFASALLNEISDGYTREDFYQHVLVLANCLQREDAVGVRKWLLDEYPNMMGNVPRRRRAAFVQGVFDCHRAGQCEAVWQALEFQARSGEGV